MKKRVFGKIGHMVSLKMLSVVLLVACSSQVVQAADNAQRNSKKLNEREKNIQQLIQRHNLWHLGEMFDKHSVCNQVRRVRDNFQEIEDIAQFSAQYKKFPQWKVPDQKEGAILCQEYRESIVPFIGCVGVFAQVQKRKPEAFVAAMIIWDKTRELTIPEL